MLKLPPVFDFWGVIALSDKLASVNVLADQYLRVVALWAPTLAAVSGPFDGWQKYTELFSKTAG